MSQLTLLEDSCGRIQSISQEPTEATQTAHSNGSVLLDTKPKPVIAQEYPDFLTWGRHDVYLECG